MAYRQGHWFVMRLRRAWLETELDREALSAGEQTHLPKIVASESDGL
jgi:hypothetical protein